MEKLEFKLEQLSEAGLVNLQYVERSKEWVAYGRGRKARGKTATKAVDALIEVLMQEQLVDLRRDQ